MPIPALEWGLQDELATQLKLAHFGLMRQVHVPRKGCECRAPCGLPAAVVNVTAQTAHAGPKNYLAMKLATKPSQSFLFGQGRFPQHLL